MAAGLAALSPPWYTLRNKFAYTFGCDPAVSVGELDTSQKIYTIPITVDDEAKGQALRTIISHTFPMGNITVETVVRNSQGILWSAVTVATEQGLLDVVNAAFAGNPLFVKADTRTVYPNIHQVGVIMTKSVVQFYNDDLSDFFHNFNGVTANVVGDLIQLWYINGLQIVMGTAKTV